MDFQKLPCDVLERIIRHVASPHDPIMNSHDFAMFVARNGDDDGSFHDTTRFGAVLDRFERNQSYGDSADEWDYAEGVWKERKTVIHKYSAPAVRYNAGTRLVEMTQVVVEYP